MKFPFVKRSTYEKALSELDIMKMKYNSYVDRSRKQDVWYDKFTEERETVKKLQHKLHKQQSDMINHQLDNPDVFHDQD